MAIILFTGSGYILYTSILSENKINDSMPNMKTIIEGPPYLIVSWDSNADELVQTISWGLIEPNNTVEFTLYFLNVGINPLSCELTWNETSWKPEGANQFFNLYWNLDSLIEPGKSVEVLLSLWASPEADQVDNFSFNVVILVSEISG